MISPTVLAIYGVATRVDATTRLLQCTRSLLDEDHRPIIDIAIRQLWLCIEGARYAAHKMHGQNTYPSKELLADVRTTTDDELQLMLPGEVLDSYVSMHLDATRAALLVVESIYLESNSSPSCQVGVAMFECLHWIAAARDDLRAHAEVLLKTALAA